MKKTVYICSECKKQHEKVDNGFQCECGNKTTIPKEIEVEDPKGEIKEAIEEKQEDLEKRVKKTNGEKMIHVTASFDTLESNSGFTIELQSFIFEKLRTKENVSVSVMEKEKYDRLEKQKEKETKSPKEEKKEEKLWH